MTFHNKHPNKKLINTLLIILAMLSIISTVTTPSFTKVNAAETTMADVSEAASDPKLYTLDQKSDWKENNKMMDVGHVWSFLGLNKKGIMSKDRDNSVKTGIDSLVLPKDSKGIPSGTQNVSVVVKAAQLPIVMKDYGLDKTSNGIGSTIGRFAGGVIIFIALGLVFLVNLLLSIVMWLITNLNPIMLIQTAMNNSGWGLFNITDGISQSPFLKALVGTEFGSVVDLIISLTFPILLAGIFGLAVAFLFWVPHSRNGNTRGKFLNGFKWIFKRLAFLFLVPSIAGSLFSAGLQLFGGGISSPAAMAQKQFNSTYIKYGDWVDNSRMYLPNQATVGQVPFKGDYPSDNDKSWKYNEPKTNALNPQYILAINALGVHNSDAISAFTSNTNPGTNGSGIISNSADSGITNNKGVSGGNANESTSLGSLIGAKSISNSNTMNGVTNASVVNNLFPTIIKWMHNDKYTANDFESTIAGLYTGTKNSNEKTTSSDAFDAIKDDVTDGKDSNGKPKSAFQSGYIKAKDGIGYDNAAQGYGAATWIAPSEALLAKPASLDANDTSNPAPSGLSTIGMWNYLNTTVEGKTLTQLISSKSLTSTPGYSHSKVLIGGPGAQPFTSWLLLVAVLLASVVPTFVTAIMLAKLALQGLTEYKNMFLALSGSVKAWIYLFRYAIKVMTGIFFVGLSALLIPTLIDTTLSWITTITISNNGLIGDASAMWFAAVQVVEAAILIAIMILAAKAFMASGSWIDSLVEFAVKGKDGSASTVDKGMGIFDNAVSKGIDSATQGSSGELAQTLNRANKDHAHTSPTMAKDKDGNLALGKHGELLGENDVDSQGRPLSKGEKIENEIQNLKDKLSDYENRPTKKSLENAQKEAQQQIDDSNKILQDGGYGLSADQMDTPIQSLEEMSKMKHEALGPELTQAAKQMHEAKKTLNSLEGQGEKLSHKDAMKQFVSGGASDSTMDTLKNTKAGRLLSAAAVAGATAPGLKNLNSLQNLKAQTEQSQDLADGKDVDDSEFGGLGEKDKESSLKTMSDNIEKSVNSAEALKTDFLKQSAEKRSELGNKLQELNNNQEEIDEKHSNNLAETIQQGKEAQKEAIPEILSTLNTSKEQFVKQNQAYAANAKNGERQFSKAKEHFINDSTKQYMQNAAENNYTPSKDQIAQFQSGQAKNFETAKHQHQQLQKIANLDMTPNERATQNHANISGFNSALTTNAQNLAAQYGIDAADPVQLDDARQLAIGDVMKNFGKEMAYINKDARQYVKENPDVPLQTAISKEYNRRVQEGRILPFTSNNMPYMYSNNLAQVSSIQGQMKHDTNQYEKNQKEVLSEYSSWGAGTTGLVSKNVADRAFRDLTVSNTPYLKQYLTATAPRNTNAYDMLANMNSYQNNLKAFNNFEVRGQNLTPLEIDKKAVLQQTLNSQKRKLIDSGLSSHMLNSPETLNNGIQDLTQHYSNLKLKMNESLNKSNFL